MRGVAAAAAVIGLCLVRGPAAVEAQAPARQPAVGPAAASASQLQRAFDLAYNLDHDQGMALLEAAMREHPNDPALPRAHATLTWLNLLFRRGTVLVDNYLGPVSKSDVKIPPPPAAVNTAFQSNVAKAVALAEARLARAPDDPGALFELGSALGLQASWSATVDGRVMGAFGSARRAYNLHERVLTLAPHRIDAGLIVGIYRYLVASLALPVRWMAYVAGFGGGKEKGLQLIEAAARQSNPSQTDARFALVLLYNREKRYEPALEQLAELRKAHPRNRLVWLEAGATCLRAGKPAEAEAMLTDGMRMLAADTRPRMLGEEGYWFYSRGTARVRLKKAAEATADLTEALQRDQLPWVRARTHLELGKAADLAGNRAAAVAEYDRAQQLASRAGDGDAAAAARRLKVTPYRGA